MAKQPYTSYYGHIIIYTNLKLLNINIKNYLCIQFMVKLIDNIQTYSLSSTLVSSC